MITETDPLEELKRLAAAKSAAPRDTTDPLDALKASKPRSAPDESDGPGVGSKILGSVASLVRDIPGGEAAQAGVRSLIRRQSYRDALSDIRTAEDAAPTAATLPARVIGGALSSAALPGGAAAKGAQYGALTAALSSDPNSGGESRAIGAGFGAGVGYLGGKYAGKVVGKIAEPIAERLKPFTAPIVRPVVRLGEASAPKAEGFIGNGMGNVMEAVKAQKAAAAEPILSPGMSIDQKLRALLAKSAETLPRGEMTGAKQFTDAEIAMGLDQAPAMTTEQALEETLKHLQQGGTLSSARASAPSYAGRPVIMRKP